MLKYGNRDFRNLQEQVYANMKNIEDMIKGSSIIADLKTANIVGEVSDAEELPDPDTYTGQFGDAFLVGSEEDYDLYVFTKAYENENAPSWFNVGTFPEPGPQGPQGPQGEPGEGIRDAAELLEFLEGADAVDVALNSEETKVKIDLSAAEKAVIGNKLALPESAPASQILVGVNTSKEQNAINIGDGLVISSGDLQVNTGDGVSIDEQGKLTMDTSVVAKINNSFQLPEVAPLKNILAGVNTSDEQIDVNLPEGELLIDANNNLRYYYTLDFNAFTSITDTAVAAILAAGTYEKIKIINYDSSHQTLWLRKFQAVKLNGTGATQFNISAWDPSNPSLSSNVYILETATPIVYQSENTLENADMSGFGVKSYIPGSTCYIKLSVNTTSGVISLTKDYYTARNNTPLLQIYDWVGQAAFTTLTGTATYKPGSTLLNNSRKVYDTIVFTYTDSAENNEQIVLKIISYNKSTYDAKIFGRSDKYNYTGTINLSSGAYSILKKAADGIFEVGTALTIYANAQKTRNIGAYTVYKDNGKNQMFIEMTNANLFTVNVYDTADAEITVSGKSIVDYTTGQSPVLRLLVETDGTDYYLSKGLYQSVTVTAAFTKPVGYTVGSIQLKLKSNARQLSPSCLFGGSGLIDTLPVQYNGIDRTSVTAIDTSGVFLKISGSSIAFGTDNDVNFSICLDKNIVKEVVVN